MSRFSIKLLMQAAAASSLIFAIPSFTVPAVADSQIRMVRLSEVQGDVQVDRNIGQGYERAFLNLPMTQGVKLRTRNDGRAEVEFEDGSTMRITPNTVIEFPQLSLRDSGVKVSTVHLQEGTAYLNFSGAKDDEFAMTFAHEKVALAQSAHLRVEMDDTTGTLAVFSGDVQVAGDSGTVAVSKNHTATFDLTDDDRHTLAKDLEPDPFDAWDKEQNQYHQQYASNGSSNYSPYAYGTSDLNYYGSFSNYPGYGNVWQPYFAGAGWDPFMNGSWAYAPGFGYGWVSAYPWGWTPYHSGNWVYLPNGAWGWQPGGTYTGWNAPRIINSPTHYTLPQPPTSGQGTVVVNRGPLPIQSGRSFNKMEITKNSAGLGIPRGGVKNLSQLSSAVQQQGFATAKVHTAPIGVPSWHGGYFGPSSMGAWQGGSAGSGSVAHSSGGHAGGGGHH